MNSPKQNHQGDQCPSVDDLRALIGGSLANVAEQSIEAHIATCEICGQTLEDICRDDQAKRWQYLAAKSKSESMTAIGSEKLSPRSRDLLETAPQLDGYEILSIAGKGGMGVVYKARQLSLQREVAIKMLHSTAPDDLQRMERFKNEADSIASIQHPNVVSIYEICHHEDVPFIVLEYIHGPDLSQLIKQSAPFDDFSAAQLVQKLALAVDAAHQQNLIHRDLKPANILMRFSGERRDGVVELRDCEPKIADFGLAKSFEFDNKTKTSVLVGTPSYMAPEQITCPEDWAKPTVDVYALGVILYELLTGQIPFKARSTFEQFKKIETQDPASTRSLNRSVSKDLDAICLKCLEKSPDQRYVSTKLLADDLDRFLRRETVVARSVRTVTRVRKWVGRNKLQVALGLVGVVALAVLGTLLTNVAKQRQVAVEDFQKRLQNTRELFIQAKSAELLDLSQWDPVLKEIERALKIQDQFPRLLDQAEAKKLYDKLEFHRATRQLYFDVDEVVLKHELKSQKRFVIADCSDALKTVFADFEWANPTVTVQQAADQLQSLDEKSLEAFLTAVCRGLLYISDWQDRDWYFELVDVLDKNEWRKSALNAASNQDASQSLALMEKPDVQISSGSSSDFGRFFYDVPDVEPQLVIEFLKKCHLQNPASFWLNFRMANAISKFEFTVNAIPYMRAAIAQRDSEPIRMQLGSMFERMEDYNAAGREYTSIIEQNPDNALAFIRIAGVFRHQQRFKEAIENFDRALELDPATDAVGSELLSTYIESGDEVAAEEIARQWIDDQNPNASFYFKAVAFDTLERFDEAAENFKRAIEADGEVLRYRFELADLYRQQGQWEQATQELNKLRELIPRELAVVKMMMDIHVQQKNFEAAIQLAKSKLELFKREPKYYRYLADVYEKAGEVALAETNYNISAVRLGQLAILYKNQRNFDLAVMTCQKAIEIQPSISQANFLLVQILCMLDRMDEALEASYRYQKNAPNSVYSHASVLNTLVLLKRYDEAIASFEKGQEFDGDPPKIFTDAQLDRLKKLAAENQDATEKN